jgi:hypothetical protein
LATLAVGLYLVLAGMIRLASPVSAEQQVTLGWEPSLDEGVAGYAVYYGAASGAYSNRISAGSAISATISGLQEGLTYFFVVTACNALGLESLPSNEVSYTVPGAVLTIQKLQMSGFSGAFFIGSSGVVPPVWVLQVSEDMKTWRPLARGANGPVGVTVVTSGASSLFFRLTGD